MTRWIYTGCHYINFVTVKKIKEPERFIKIVSSSAFNRAPMIYIEEKNILNVHISDLERTMHSHKFENVGQVWWLGHDLFERIGNLRQYCAITSTH